MVARRSTTNWTARELRFCLQGIRAPMGPLLGSVVQHRVNRPHALGYRKKHCHWEHTRIIGTVTSVTHWDETTRSPPAEGNRGQASRVAREWYQGGTFIFALIKGSGRRYSQQRCAETRIMEPQNGPMKLYDILEGYARWSIATGLGVDGLALVGRAMYIRKRIEVGYQ